MIPDDPFFYCEQPKPEPPKTTWPIKALIWFLAGLDVFMLGFTLWGLCWLCKVYEVKWP